MARRERARPGAPIRFHQGALRDPMAVYYFGTRRIAEIRLGSETIDRRSGRARVCAIA